MWKGTLASVALGIALVAAAPARAGKAQTDGSPPTSGGKAGSGWNPSFSCTTGPTDTLDDLFECLADGLEEPPPPCLPGTPGCGDPDDRDDYRVTRLPWPEFGLLIRRLDGSEIDRLYFWEDDPAIRMIAVEVQRAGLAGRIAAVAQAPSKNGGTIRVTVDGIPVVVDTSRLRTGEAVTQELLFRLRGSGFDARLLGEDYLVVLQDLITGGGVTRIEFESTDPGISRSDLALIPLPELLDALHLSIETSGSIPSATAPLAP